MFMMALAGLCLVFFVIYVFIGGTAAVATTAALDSGFIAEGEEGTLMLIIFIMMGAALAWYQIKYNK